MWDYNPVIQLFDLDRKSKKTKNKKWVSKLIIHSISLEKKHQQEMYIVHWHIVLINDSSYCVILLQQWISFACYHV